MTAFPHEMLACFCRPMSQSLGMIADLDRNEINIGQPIP